MEEAYVKECNIGIVLLLFGNIRHTSVHSLLTSECQWLVN